MDQEWQLVSRRRRGKPHNGPSHTRSASSKTLNASTRVQHATNSSKLKNAAGEEVVEPVAEVSTEKQAQIIRRVRTIADKMHDSVMLKDAVRVVVDHFEVKMEKTEAEEEQPMLVGYGLGSFCASSNAVHQLGFLLALKEALDKVKDVVETEELKSGDSIQNWVEIFDPAMNKSDTAIAEHFKVKVIQENEHGRRQVDRNTVFFMPHCGKTLYQNVLACNWGPALQKACHHRQQVSVIGVFSAYGDRVLAAKERQELLLVSVLPYLEEVSLSCGVSKTHEDFARYEAAFNDLSVHRFPPPLLERALRSDSNSNLREKMAAAATSCRLSAALASVTAEGITACNGLVAGEKLELRCNVCSIALAFFKIQVPRGVRFHRVSSSGRLTFQRAVGMTFARCIGGEPDPLCCAAVPHEIAPGRMKVRQLLGWTRPTDMATHSQNHSKSGAPASASNNREHDDDEMVDAPIEEMGKLSIDEKLPPEPNAPRAGNNNVAKEMEASHLTASNYSTKTDGDNPEEPEDKVSADTIFSPSSRDATGKGTSRPRTSRCSSDDSSNSSTASSSRSPSGGAMPTSSGSSTNVPTDILSPTASPPPKVTFRKGEKSFLDFHQHYAITRHLGEGSYSTVKQVTHRKKGGFYACKIVDKLSLSDVDRAALSHEVRVLSSVSHVNIMRLYEVIEDDAKCYLVTELAEGGDLFDRIVKQGKFPEREAQKVAAALVEALHYCHMHSIIHRDVKPENVLLSGDDVKLCDFGFARQLNHQEEQASDSCGTPGYAAPEILDGRSYGLEVDVFSLGVVTYIMLCGYPPFPMKLAQLRTHRFNVRYPSKDWAAIHPDVKTLISKMLHVDPKERPSMAVLRCHPWIQAGRLTLERLRRENEERRRVADLTRRQQAASAIRKKLVMGGFEAIKYGRNGLPHRTKLRLSTDGKVLSWQPKLLKRSLLRYQNARSFTSLFGIGGKDNNGTSQPDLHAAQPETNRIPTGGIVGTPSTEHEDSEQSANGASSPHSTDSSPSSSTSDAINEKRLWWRSLRRERGAKTERTASGGFTLNFTTRQTGSTPSSPVTPPAAKMLRMRSPSATLDQGPMTPSATSPDRLDDSIKLHDIREMLVGDDAQFFAGHATNLPNTAKRAVDPACVLSVCTRFRELHLEFPNEGVRDGFVYLLQQATLPLQQSQPPRLMKSTPTPPPAPQNISSRGYDTFVATTPPDEECKMQLDVVSDKGTDEHSSRPEVDEDVETEPKEATVAISSNQDE